MIYCKYGLIVIHFRVAYDNFISNRVYLLLEEFLSNIISMDDIPMKKVTYFIWSYFLIELLSHLAIIYLKFRHKKITHFIYYIHVFLSMNQWYMIFFFLLISPRLADTPLQEHDSSTANIQTSCVILMQKNFRSVIQKKTRENNRVYIGTVLKVPCSVKNIKWMSEPHQVHLCISCYLCYCFILWFLLIFIVIILQL